MKYLSNKETAVRWGISERRIQVLCKQNRIPGIITIGRTWGIPDDAQKPADARVKSGKYVKRKEAKKSDVVNIAEFALESQPEIPDLTSGE